jgi:hypothetical protein
MIGHPGLEANADAATPESAAPGECQTCKGRGEVGWFDHSELCPGWVTEPCPHCNTGEQQ